MKAPLPPDEWPRLQALARYAVLDTLPEAAFDRLTSLAADLFAARLAVINFVDEDRQWGKSCVGVDDTEAPREDSFCAWTILQDEVFVVPDATQDERFVDNPMVTGEPHVRLYAGAPLTTPDGFRIGSLCVTDDRPRDFAPEDARRLRVLADLVMDELEARRRINELELRAEGLAALTHALKRTAAFSESVLAVNDLLGLDLPAADVLRHGAALLARHVDADVAWLHAVRPDGADGQVVWSTAEGRRDLLSGARPVPGDAVTAIAGTGGTRFLDPEIDGPGEALADLGPLDGAHFVLSWRRLAGGEAWSSADRTLVASVARSLGAVREHAARHSALVRDARRDTLTGLGNRAALDEALAAAGPRTAVAMLDLDGLKTVNDRFGHARGDTLLRLFGGALSVEAPEGARVFRPGGDEFVIVAVDDGPDDGNDDGDAWTADVRAAIDAAVAALRATGFADVGVSLGTAFAREATTPEGALALADTRMYAEKRRRSAEAALPPGVPRPAPPREERVFALGALVVDAGRRVASYEGRHVRLTPKEGALLAALASAPERVFSREELAARAWGEGAAPGGNTVDVHLASVRKKLAALAPHLGVRAVRGAGYGLSVGMPGGREAAGAVPRA